MSEIVKRLIETRRLNEMATSWKDIKRELGSSITKEVLIHLIKLYYWSEFDREDEYHWENEIYNFYHDIPKQKNNNRYPEADKIYNTIWDYWGDTFDSIQYVLNNDTGYKNYPRIMIDEKAIEFCSDYIRWLSNNLSQNGAVTRSEVLDEIHRLYTKYNLT